MTAPVASAASSDLSVLLGYQQRWVADSTSRVKIAVKSRRIGLTWAEAVDAVLTAAAAQRGQDVYYTSYNAEITKEFVRTCGEWAQALGQAASELREEILSDADGKEMTAHRIDMASGHRIMGLPSRPAALRGRQGRVIVDEAAFVPDLAEVLKAAFAFLLWGGDVRVISTYNGRYLADGSTEEPFWRLVEDAQAGRSPHALHRITIEDALRDGLYRRITEVVAARRGAAPEAWSEAAERRWLAELVATYGPGADEELFCIPSQAGARYFDRELVERAMRADIPVLEYQQPDKFVLEVESVRRAETEGWIAARLAPVLDAAAAADARQRWYLGWDVARSGDLSVLALFRETRTLGLEAICYVEMRNVPFSEQERICYAVTGRPQWAAAAIDARGNGQQLAERALQRYGAGRVHAVMLTRRIYGEEWPAYRALMEDRRLALPRSDGLLLDHQAVALDRGVPVVREVSGRGTSGQRHGDGAVAGMLGNYARRHDEGTYQPYKYEPVPVSSRWRWRQEEDGEWD